MVGHSLGKRVHVLDVAVQGRWMDRAFNTVAAVVRFKDRAILVTSSFFFASPFNL
jgi:hypothetical protein